MQDFKKNNNSELEIEKNTEKSEKKSRKKAVQVTAFILGLVLILITLSESFNPMNWYHIGRFELPLESFFLHTAEEKEYNRFTDNR